jgi:hypothetical protein
VGHVASGVARSPQAMCAPFIGPIPPFITPGPPLGSSARSVPHDPAS